MNRTPLYEFHATYGKLVDFADYEMPIWYTGIADEHLAVRRNAGIFDVSHMGRVVVSGPDSGKLLDSIVPTVSASQPVGKSFYTLLLNENAGIIDDIVVVKRGEQDYLLVVNASNHTKDISHIRSLSKSLDVKLEDITENSTMIAVQGPEAINVLQPITMANLSSMKRFTNALTKVGGGVATVTRTGYTGEDGFEVIIHDSGLQDGSAARSIWNDLLIKATPCGLGARDSLRIEAGLPLFGSDIDETTNPFEAALSWVITKEKHDYSGYHAVKFLMSAPPSRIRRGITLSEGIPRHGFEITDGNNRLGEVTSGTFSPLLRKGIAIGYVQQRASATGSTVEVDIRGKKVKATVTKMPFYDETLYGWKRSATKTI